MAWQAFAAIAAQAMLQKMMSSRTAVHTEAQQGFEEAETGGMYIGESIRPGISQDKSMWGNMLKSFGTQYAMKGLDAATAQTGSGAIGALGGNFDFLDQMTLKKIWESFKANQPGPQQGQK